LETQTIYPINSYGTAMAPFYSTLALWVGCVVLAAVIKVEADPKRLKLRHVTDTQLYWGRFLTYWFFGQIQSAVIVWGDLNILGCQCLHPGLLYFAGSVTSFVFVCLIYSLVLVIGDVGKAVVVVVMIVQIAGSSGSYPIEILPEIFTKIYVFFPYPYAINAMRETICGLYRYDYWKYLGQLLIFGAVGLFIGLVLRRPLHGVNEFVEEEMHESGVL
jgi:putative membrane protein